MRTSGPSGSKDATGFPVTHPRRCCEAFPVNVVVESTPDHGFASLCFDSYQLDGLSQQEAGHNLPVANLHQLGRERVFILRPSHPLVQFFPRFDNRGRCNSAITNFFGPNRQARSMNRHRYQQSKTMKAVVIDEFGGIEKMKVRDLPIPKVPPTRFWFTSKRRAWARGTRLSVKLDSPKSLVSSFLMCWVPTARAPWNR